MGSWGGLVAYPPHPPSPPSPPRMFHTSGWKIKEKEAKAKVAVKGYNQGVTKRCRLSLLTNSALVL
jgi:hypothetical protein